MAHTAAADPPPTDVPGHWATLSHAKPRSATLIHAGPSATLGHTEPHSSGWQVVLLVHTLAKAHGVSFSAHGLVPMGSFSRVYRLDEPKVSSKSK